MEYSIRFATNGDINKIMEFIDIYWRKNHILARDRNLFEWQYGGDGDKLNIVIGLDDDGNIQGMLGFVAYDITDNKDIALALWKANPSTGFLGVRLLKYLMDNEPHREIVCPGINMKTTSKIYELVSMKVGQMKQWYRLAKRQDYLIAKIEDEEIPAYNKSDMEFELVKVRSLDELKEYFNFDSMAIRSHIPRKSMNYIDRRYFRHPIYRYIVYALCRNKSKATTVFIFRVQDCNDSHALRLIDCVGDYENIQYITKQFDSLLDEMECEYMDVYETGIDDELFLSAGWKKVENNGNVIPDYFSPFEHRKVDIYFSSSIDNAVLFKGDGDQDRPN